MYPGPPPKRITDPTELALHRAEFQRRSEEYDREMRQILAVVITFVVVALLVAGVSLTGAIIRTFWN